MDITIYVVTAIMVTINTSANTTIIGTATETIITIIDKDTATSTIN